MSNTRPIYFDYAAASPVHPRVIAALPGLAAEYGANPESAHPAGRRCRFAMEEAARRIATALLQKECPVVWAPTGTDLFNLLAALEFPPGARAVTGVMEHPALTAALGRRMTVSKVPAEAFAEAAAGAALAAHVQVQSETGMAFAPRSAGALLAIDAIQAAGKLPLAPGGDLYAVSGHKFGAPGGAALLLASERAGRLAGQFKALRDAYRIGRPEPAAVLALALAAETAAEEQAEVTERVRGINAFLRSRLDAFPLPLGGRARCTVAAEAASPYILHLTLPGYQGAVVARILAEEGVMLSSGSACQAESAEPSPALLALGYGRREAYGGLRLSFGFGSTMEEAERFLALFGRAVRDY